jgi:hypothetical protein
MAFKLHRTDSAKTQCFEYKLMTDNEACLLGEALVLTSGKLTKCAATGIPQYISLGAASAGTNVTVPVVMVVENDVYEVATSADASSNEIGTLVTIDSTGLLVTATSTNGVFTLVEKVGTGNTGTKVRGCFRR